MKSTVMNYCKEMIVFSDFPPPDHFPMCMPHLKAMQYFKLYASHFNLMPHIKFKHDVVSCKPTHDFTTSGQWELKVEDLVTKKVITDIYDYVLVCTGHHAMKHTVKFKGQDEFDGKILHGHEYRTFEGYEDKKVLVVGLGNSGIDIAMELSRLCSQVRFYLDQAIIL